MVGFTKQKKTPLFCICFGSSLDFSHVWIGIDRKVRLHSIELIKFYHGPCAYVLVSTMIEFIQEKRGVRSKMFCTFSSKDDIEINFIKISMEIIEIHSDFEIYTVAICR